MAFCNLLVSKWQDDLPISKAEPVDVTMYSLAAIKGFESKV